MLLIAASAGPYVSAGIRTEQVVTYLGIGLFLFTQHRSTPRTTPTGIEKIAKPWLLYVCIVLLATIANTISPANLASQWLRPGSTLAGLDNVIAPLMIMGFVHATHDPRNQQRLLRVASLTLIVVGICASAASWLQAFTSTDLVQWWGSSTSVAILAEQNGRYGGIFNQPAEAGLFFGVVLLVSAYLSRRHPVISALGAAAAVLGGFLAVSKVLIFAAIPIAIWQFFFARGGARVGKMILAATGMIVAILLFPKLALPDWPGLAQLQRVMATFQTEPLAAVTAGRVGSDSTLSQTLDPVIDLSPMLGFGAAGVSLPYDNAWIESLVVGGILGAAAITLVIARLMSVAYRSISNQEGALLRALTALSVVTALGLPMFTANRASTILWIFICILVASQNTQPSRSKARL